MQSHLKKIGAKIYLYEKDALIQKVAYIYEGRIKSEPLLRFIHLGMFTDSVLFGEECQIRFLSILSPRVCMIRMWAAWNLSTVQTALQSSPASNKK